MMEDCATVMSALQGCNDDKAVVETFMEALKGKVGADRYRMWFNRGVEFKLISSTRPVVSNALTPQSTKTPEQNHTLKPETLTDKSAWVAEKSLLVSVRGQFALDRLQNHFLSELRGAAMQAYGGRIDVLFELDETQAHQVDLPLDEESSDALMVSNPNTSSPSPTESQTDLDTIEKQDQVERANLDSRVPMSQPMARIDSRHRRPSRQSVNTGRSSRRSKRTADSIGGLFDQTAQRRSPVTKQGLSEKRQPPAAHQSRDRAKPSEEPVQLDLPDLSKPATNNVPKLGTKVSSVESRGNGEAKMSSANFIPGQCNRLAHTAMIMACQDPTTASPLFLFGPTGTGKTHLLHAIADQLRRRYRLRRVMNLSAEQFTNDFICSVGNSGITAFRRRYREVDALLVDDIQFLGSKKATLREMLYTVETLSGLGKPLIFAGSESPTEINGLSDELAGRMASGLVCNLQPLDAETREKLLRRWIDDRCEIQVPEVFIDAITPLLAGDGRVVSGVVNIINTLQRMLGRCPTLDEMRQFGGQLLRVSKPMTTLGLIESAVCEAFRLPEDSLRSKSQTRAVTGPRKLAMYLSRQLTPSAYSEIADHFGGRSHSTAISAEQHVRNWLTDGAQIGRGITAMSAREALDRVETLLRTG